MKVRVTVVLEKEVTSINDAANQIESMKADAAKIGHVASWKEQVVNR